MSADPTLTRLVAALEELADEWDAEADKDMWAQGPRYAGELRAALLSARPRPPFRTGIPSRGMPIVDA